MSKEKLRSWDEFFSELLTAEERAEGDRCVAIIHRYIQAREACFEALCDYLPEIDVNPRVQQAVRARLRESMLEGKGLPDIEDLVPLCAAERRRIKFREKFCRSK